ncbi:MAG: hypothetical protein F6K58_08735 [Symploca sp. SIO2E9]|nr:hypothetical protein [Symploca sp. SIO2E9]
MTHSNSYLEDRANRITEAIVSIQKSIELGCGQNPLVQRTRGHGDTLTRGMLKLSSPRHRVSPEPRQPQPTTYDRTH